MLTTAHPKTLRARLKSRTGRDVLHAFNSSFVPAFMAIAGLQGLTADTAHGQLLATLHFTVWLIVFVSIEGRAQLVQDFAKIPGMNRLTRYTMTHKPPQMPKIPGPVTLTRRLLSRTNR